MLQCPRWLLDEIGLLDGVLNEDRTTVKGTPNNHNRKKRDSLSSHTQKYPPGVPKGNFWEFLRFFYT
jgi:hypothetical protein